MSCTFCGGPITVEIIRTDARSKPIAEHMAGVRLEAARKVVRAVMADLLEASRMAKTRDVKEAMVCWLSAAEWFNANYDDAALRRIVEDGE